MSRVLSVACFIVWTNIVQAQQVTIEVHNLVNQGALPIPSSTATVRISRAANLPLLPMVPVRPPAATGPSSNQYVLQGLGIGPLADIKVSDRGCHPWAVRDLLVGTSGEQRLVVQLFRLDYPIKAPQCFALKTEYERLFRDEQQKVLEEQMRQPNPNLDPDRLLRIARRAARMQYADGLLALPNPDRRDRQPLWVRQMLEEMEQQQDLQPSQYDIDELENMVDGLFRQYDMNGFEQFVPSRWQTTYQSPNGPVNSEVMLYGTYGTFSGAGGRLQTLDHIDMAYEENENGDGGFVISGRWRIPGTNSSGTFHWKVDDADQQFRGTMESSGNNAVRQWSGRRNEFAYDGSPFPPPPGTVEIAPPPAPPAPPAAPAAPAPPRRPVRRAPPVAPPQ